MTKEEFVAQLDRAAADTDGLPVTTAMLKHLSADLKKGNLPWWTATMKAWEKRRFVDWAEAWGLFLTCVHYEVLTDAKNPLVPYFPSCEGTDEVDPSKAFAKFLANPPKSFFDHLKTSHRRAYVEARAPVWIGPAMLFFQRRQLPFYLVEVNAGAGLNLAADVVVPREDFDSELVAARIGLDPEPQPLEDIDCRRWLTAALMTDQLPLIKALDRAMETVRDRQFKEANFIQLFQCPTALAAEFVMKNIPADDKDVGLLLVNMGTTVRMTDPEYEDYKKSIAETLGPWEDRALWVEFESVRGELYSSTYQQRAHRLRGGELKSMAMVSYDFGSRKTEMKSEESVKFLA